MNKLNIEPVADAFPYNAASNLQDLNEADRRYDNLLDRKGRMTEHGTVGVLTLNGASVIATFTALQVGSEALGKLGLSSSDIATSLSSFLFGAMIAVVAIWVESVNLTKIASKQYLRVDALRAVARTLASPADQKHVDALGVGLELVRANPPVDFEFSKWALVLQNLAASTWVVGTGLLFYRCVKVSWGL